MLRDILGLNFKVVLGYADSPAEMMAMERKEVDGRITGLSTVRAAHAEWLNPNGKIRPLVAICARNATPVIAEHPDGAELARNDAERQLIEISEFSYKIARPFIAPPGLPADRAAALQKAFMDVHKDSEFLAEADKLKIDVSPIDGKEALEAISVLEKASPEVLAKIKAVLEAR